MSATTSGSYIFSPSVVRIINQALIWCGAIAEDEVPTDSQTSEALYVLNGIISTMSASGINVWAEEEAILFLQPNQPQYKLGPSSPDSACLWNDLTTTSLATGAATGAVAVSLASVAGLAVGDNIGLQLDSGKNFWTTIGGLITGSSVPLSAALPSPMTSGGLVFDYTNPLMRPLRVPFARRFRYQGEISTPCTVLSRIDYAFLSNQYNTGSVNQFFFDPQRGNGVYTNAQALMNTWPAPADNSAALRFTMQRPLQGFLSLRNLPDVPDEWIIVLQYNLAFNLTSSYKPPAQTIADLKDKTTMWQQVAAGWNREPEPVLFSVGMRPGQR